MASPFYIISGDVTNEEEFIRNLVSILQMDLVGKPFIQIRVKRLSGEARAQFIQKIMKECLTLQLETNRLLLNCSDEQTAMLLFTSGLESLGGLHLTGALLDQMERNQTLKDTILNPIIASGKILAASCHNSRDLLMAAKMHISFAVLSPVLPSTSCPSDKTLGWSQFSQMVQKSTIPVYALGGMTAVHLEEAQECGAVGIAAIKAFWTLKAFK